MILARNFSFGVPCPSSSSVIWKFVAGISDCSGVISSFFSASSTASGCVSTSDGSWFSSRISCWSEPSCSTSKACWAPSRSACLCASCRSSYFSSSSGDKKSSVRISWRTRSATLFHFNRTSTSGLPIFPFASFNPFASWEASDSYAPGIPGAAPPVPYSFFRNSAASFISWCSMKYS